MIISGATVDRYAFVFVGLHAKDGVSDGQPNDNNDDNIAVVGHD